MLRSYQMTTDDWERLFSLRIEPSVYKLGVLNSHRIFILPGTLIDDHPSIVQSSLQAETKISSAKVELNRIMLRTRHIVV